MHTSIRNALRKVPFLMSLFLALYALAFVVMPVPSVKADSFGLLGNYILKGEPAGRAITADDTDIAIVVKYVGTSASGKVAVAANGDLTFTSGAEGSEAAESAFECPVSGGLGGVIDVSDSACNTLGEVVDTINGNCSGCSTSNWRAVIVDGIRADSSNDTLLTISATAATAATGLSLAWDTDVALTTTLALGTCRDMTCFIQGGPAVNAGTLKPNPWIGQKTILWEALALSTYGSGTSVVTVRECSVTNQTAGSETCTTLWSEANGATATPKLFDDWINTGFHITTGKKGIVRITNSAAHATANLMVNATTFPNQ